MLLYIVVIGLVLPSFTIAEDATEKPQVKCDKPEVQEAGKQFIDCFQKNVKNSIDKSNLACDTLTEDLGQFVDVANKSCYNDTRSGSAFERGAMFINLVEFSIRNREFADFVNNSGVACLREAAQDKIVKCVNEQFINAIEPIGESDQNTKYDHLWEMASLTIDPKSCEKTERIKHCTQEAMRSEGYYKCNNQVSNVLYVGSLFDFMLEQCSTLIPDWKEQTREKENHIKRKIDKDTRTTHALLGVLLAMAILAMFYVCVRDCRAPRGPWKALNERISMSVMNRRRRSLVNNETCPGN